MSNKEDYLEDENSRLHALLRQAGIDAAESDVTYKLQRLLLAEMHHRIKNMMAMVQSIVFQTLASDKTGLRPLRRSRRGSRPYPIPTTLSSAPQAKVRSWVF